MCLELSLVTYILRLLLILAIIIAMNFTVTQLRAGLVHRWVGGACFYMDFVVYVWIT